MQKTIIQTNYNSYIGERKIHNKIMINAKYNYMCFINICDYYFVAAEIIGFYVQYYILYYLASVTVIN